MIIESMDEGFLLFVRLTALATRVHGTDTERERMRLRVEKADSGEHRCHDLSLRDNPDRGRQVAVGLLLVGQ